MITSRRFAEIDSLLMEWRRDSVVLDKSILKTLFEGVLESKLIGKPLNTFMSNAREGGCPRELCDRPNMILNTTDKPAETFFSMTEDS